MKTDWDLIRSMLYSDDFEMRTLGITILIKDMETLEDYRQVRHHMLVPGLPYKSILKLKQVAQAKHLENILNKQI